MPEEKKSSIRKRLSQKINKLGEGAAFFRAPSHLTSFYANSENGSADDTRLETEKVANVESKQQANARRSDKQESELELSIRRSQELLTAFDQAKSEERRTAKVDLCPEVHPDLVKRVFQDVARSCGFSDMYELSETKWMVFELKHHNQICGPYGNSQYEIPIIQELRIRDYGKSSTKYVSLNISWLDFPKRRMSLQRQSSLGKAAGSFLKPGQKKLAKLNKSDHQQIVDEVLGRWRATLFQKAFALESANLENTADSPWQSLDADEVDYVSSDDEGGSDGGEDAADEQDDLPAPPSIRVATANNLASSSSTYKASTNNLVRPKSVLKLPDASSNVDKSMKKRRQSVQFSKGNQVRFLDVSTAHREARMSEGCRATNRYGQERPFVSTRNGSFVFLNTSELVQDDERKPAKAARSQSDDSERHLLDPRRRVPQKPEKDGGGGKDQKEQPSSTASFRRKRLVRRDLSFCEEKSSLDRSFHDSTTESARTRTGPAISA